MAITKDRMLFAVSGAELARPAILRPLPLDPGIPVKHIHYAGAKRALDIVVAGVGIALFSWLFLIVAALVKLTSRGPVIFRQTRVGQGGRRFTCFKFRSMCVDAEGRRRDILHLNEVSGPVFKIKNDPRMTPIGRWIRKFS